jgi:hypothetical protein
MPPTKYGKYIIRDIIEESRYSRITTPTAKYRGDRGGRDLTFEWSCITQPLVMDDEPEVNDFDRFLLFASVNIKDFTEFDAEIELPLGKEGKKQVINAPTYVYLPKGLVHGPVNFKKIKKPLVFMNICLSPENSTEWVAADYSKYLAKPEGLMTLEEQAAMAARMAKLPPMIQATHPTGTPSRYIRMPAGPGMFLWSEKLGFPGKLCMGYHAYNYRDNCFLEPVHYHRQLHQRSIFLGGNPLDIEDFDAEIDLWLGKEHEKHVIDTCAVAHAPPGLVHLGDEVRQVGKPFIHILTMMGTGEYYNERDKVLLSREEAGEVMISEGARDYVPPSRED